MLLYYVTNVGSQTEPASPQAPGPAPRSSQACGVVCFRPNNEWHGWWAHTKTQQRPACSPARLATQTLINLLYSLAHPLPLSVSLIPLSVSVFLFSFLKRWFPHQLNLFSLLYFYSCSFIWHVMLYSLCKSLILWQIAWLVMWMPKFRWLIFVW